jgi:hypothetical protein
MSNFAWASLILIPKGFSGEAPEDDAVHRADPRARQHRDGQLGDHREIDRHTIPLLDPQFLQNIRELADLAMEILISEDALIPRLALKDDRGFIAPPGLQMAINAVIRSVEFAADEPLGPGRVPL